MISDFSPLLISLKTSLSATLITIIIGVPAAWIVASYNVRFKGLLDSILTLPMILPPTVAGFFLLVLLGKRGFVGRLLERMDMSLIFTWQAAMIAAAVVAFPLMYKTARSAFEQIDRNVLDAARLLGASEWKVFLSVAVPMAWPGIVAGFLLSFARALGEFGATMMVAGNIPGRTQTIPLAIFFAAEGGDMKQAYAWVMLIFAISLAMMALMNYWNEYHKRLVSGEGRRN
ncbi:MAG: molybdate ABC transporter permease subunit [Peptoclostridium sp.]|uniref:molybdate ABC transporter permease subunit n=1 Tax=Peptoclostridium sp. TaxID=1904860 RepID=UPI00139BB3F8|nr:molybdate ABC transporter permease subunit [Peptoclostridium sp.]MZQ75327.1 molybdate ABC transporter permease subunit [Peptoclostridium sp.]